MNEYIAIQDIDKVIKREREIPTIMMWNRLEGRPRTSNFDRALRAEVRDPLFMLTRQWQMGEFKGDDAGSPVIAKVHMETTRLHKYRANEHSSQVFENDVPLETKVEQRKVPFREGNQELSLDIRLLMGRHWLKMIRDEVSDAVIDGFIKAYPVHEPDPNNREDAQICAHLTAWQQYAAAAGRAMDGAVLYFYLKESDTHHAYNRLPEEMQAELGNDGKEFIKKQGVEFTTWFEKLFYQPVKEDDDAWLPSKLEYQFECSAPTKGTEKIFTAEEYYHGHLDWYNVNVDRSREKLDDPESEEQLPTGLEKTHTYSFLPTEIHFEGMPNTRWWTFEDGRTNFGDIKPDTTDLDKLLLIEFGLVFANDWFLLPFTLPAGSAAQIRGMAVTNIFGERIWIKPTNPGSDEERDRWSMFTLNVDSDNDESASRTLLLLPTVPKIQEGKPIEEIYLIRDEMANMVWGAETRVPLPSGISKPGREAARELHDFYQRLVDQKTIIDSSAADDNKASAPIKYEIMKTVSENWIPFIPVHIDESNREIQLQRAAMPRILKGDDKCPERIRPRTILLRVGLNQDPKVPYKVFEEEVPRSGIRVYQAFQRTRWYNGRVFNWLGVRKQTGRGEDSSGLAFDQIVPVEKASS